MSYLPEGVWSFVITADFSFCREVLREKETAILTTAQMEDFACSIVVYTGKRPFQMVSAAQWTGCYSECIHRKSGLWGVLADN